MIDFKKEFKDYLYDLFVEPKTENFFYPVEKKGIEEAEGILKTAFPLELRRFYEEIGNGRIVKSKKGEWQASISNHILPPLVAAHFYNGIKEHHEVQEKEDALNYDGYWLALETMESLAPGDLPFFEIGDSSSFMVMKPYSDNPNAVWFQGFEIVEESFEKFIYNLYYKGPSYYCKDW